MSLPLSATSRSRWPRPTAWLAGCLLLACAAGPATARDTGAFSLSPHCPPGFELVQGACRLRSLYQRYDSLQGAGVGGLKTGLPSWRDGFTPQQIDLGRYLFFDPLLSADHTLSCASCHQPDRGFADGMGRSVGSRGQLSARSAPSLWNVAFLQRFFWDARADSLEQQVLEPLFKETEMANSPEALLASLRGSDAYRALFAQAFPRHFSDPAASVELEQLYTALAAFQTSLVSLNSRYDQYAHGHSDALSQREQAGLNVFRSVVARCAECHTPPLFSNQQLAVIGTPEPEGLPFDPGAGPGLGEPTLRGAFRTPGLRNIALTAPYMHSGRFASLREAVAFYTGGRGHAVPDGEDLRIHWHIWEPGLTDDELDLLVEFLLTLTDESLKPVTPVAVPSGLPLMHGPATAITTGSAQ